MNGGWACRDVGKSGWDQSRGSGFICHWDRSVRTLVLCPVFLGLRSGAMGLREMVVAWLGGEWDRFFCCH
ncbi:hypothetical protein RchiOBHm_Chr2g0134001 [Rosa chinensis]|uniref:Uncharacterized protein n=1 Tax=Rosa chinensis TaxID=74649 RepID=A0A2P6RVQ9_ROSCH|nr:hypothetical protein RchiOBHm_Chr2g0134001 [Rosa chinensis]